MEKIPDLVRGLDHRLVDLGKSRAEWCDAHNIPYPAMSYFKKYGQPILDAIEKTLGGEK